MMEHTCADVMQPPETSEDASGRISSGAQNPERKQVLAPFHSLLGMNKSWDGFVFLCQYNLGKYLKLL